ncbi:MAG: hypothetical protein BAJATHORv1_40153 [Candidatus Thorarchaeota archaeon]|nr:MAG: hypothetical protein BAJATHORv1_40153 [Candidatus Thorarchaeota archaeon]
MRISLSAIDIESIPSSITRLRPYVLDRALGQLLLPEQISLLYGVDKSPLTRLAHNVAINVAMNGNNAIFLDSGNNYNSHLVNSQIPSKRERTEILEHIIIAKIFSLSDLINISNEINEIQNLSFIVLDSLSGVLNLSGAPGSIERQRLLFKTLQVIRRLVNTTNAHFLVTSYSTNDWKTGDTRPVGGNVLAHNLDSIIHVEMIDSKKGILQFNIERSSIPITQEVFAFRMTKTGFKTLS